MSDKFQAFSKQIRHPVKYRMFLLTSLPSAYFAGIKVAAVNEMSSEATVPLKWFTKNPFRSVYVAVLSMAAEISTGVLCMGHIYKSDPPVSMLVVNMNGSFYKKATGVIKFVCNDGKKIRLAIESAKNTGEGRTVNCLTKGFNQENELVAEFNFTWSFKAKIKK